MSLNLGTGNNACCSAPIASLGGATSSVPTLFELLLQEPTAERVYLVEAYKYGVTVWDYGATTWDSGVSSPEVLTDWDVGSSSNVFRASDTGFVTKPSDSISNLAFTARAKQPYDVNREIPLRDTFQPRSTPTLGDIVCANDDGGLDKWLGLGQGWDNREVTVKLGRPTFDYASFGVIFRGRVRAIQSGESEFRIQIRDVVEDLNRPIQDSFFTTPDDLEGKPKPLLFGQCRYVGAVLIDSATRKYKVHDGPVNSITTVYDQGASVAFTADAPNGEFTLISAPSGLITATVQGDLGSGSPGVYVSKPGEIIRRIIDEHTTLTDPGDLDVSSFTALDADVGYVIGVYIDSPRNILDILDRIMASVGGYWTVTRDGKIRVATVEDPTPLTEDDEFTDDEILTISQAPMSPPAWRMRLGYRRTWRVHTEGEIAGVSLGGIQTLTEEYRQVESSDSTITTVHLGARDVAVLPTVLDVKANAQSVSNNLLALHKVDRMLLSVTVKTQPFVLNVGDVVKITSSRFNLGAGKNFLIIGIRESARTSSVEMRLWG